MDSKQVRVDPDFENKLRDIMGERLSKKLCLPTLKNMGLPEATRLLQRCPSWANIEKELRTLPKKK